jgi:carbon dioxide concentrating mechanism protein CcmN
MYSPPVQLQPISTAHYFVSGDVMIPEGVAIAPGVLLQADPDSQIIIGVGVCLGIGCVVHAHRGTITIGEGAIIGAGVLLVGQVTVGARVCIGSATTVFDCEIAADAMIAPGSLLGDRSRPRDEIHGTDPPPLPKPSGTTSATVTAEVETPLESAPLADEPAIPEAVESTGVNVYGQVYVNQLLVKLFPHKQPLDNPPES